MLALTRRTVCILVFAGVAISCANPDDVRPVAPTAPANPGTVQTLGAQRQRHRTTDDLLAAVDSVAPGFAGMFIDADGTLVLLDARAGGDARVPVFLNALRGVTGAEIGQGRRTRVQAASFSFRQLHQWTRNMLRVQLPSGVHSIDIDERRNRIVVGVAATASVQTIRTALSATGLPSSALLVERAAPVYPIQGNVFPVDTSIRHPVRPLKAGTAIQSEGVGTSGGQCTIGFTLAVGGVNTFLTASHCTTEYAAFDNGRMRQPYQVLYFGTFYDYFVGREIRDVPHEVNLGDGWCPYASGGCRWSDAALVQIDESVPVERGRIVRAVQTNGTQTSSSMQFAGFPSTMTLTQNSGHWRVVETTDQGFREIVGAAVVKVGAATGQTTGTIVETCKHSVQDPSAPGQNKWLLCHNRVSGVAYCGDSGGSVFSVLSEANHTVVALGIAVLGEPGPNQAGCDGNPFPGYYYSTIINIKADLQELTTWVFTAP